jgi:hypothetical protein
MRRLFRYLRGVTLVCHLVAQPTQSAMCTFSRMPAYENIVRAISENLPIVEVSL